jgi:hypothetical protein
MRVLFFVCFGVLFCGCDDGCRTKETRCNGQVIQICNTDQEWENVDDCKKISEGILLNFECKWDDDAEMHLCALVGGLPDSGDGEL